MIGHERRRGKGQRGRIGRRRTTEGRGEGHEWRIREGHTRRVPRHVGIESTYGTAGRVFCRDIREDEDMRERGGGHTGIGEHMVHRGEGMRVEGVHGAFVRENTM